VGWGVRVISTELKEKGHKQNDERGANFDGARQRTPRASGFGPFHPFGICGSGFFIPMTSASHAIGIDLGGSSIKAVAVTPAGETLSRLNIEFDPNHRMEWAEKIRALVQQIGRERGSAPGGI